MVRADGLTDSEAVRTALREAAARRRARSAIREEVQRLAADESDREEMRIIREQMAELVPSAPRSARGREQRGARYAVVVQAEEFVDLSTTLVAPTSTGARPASFRPTINLNNLKDEHTRVLVEQTTVVDPQRLGRSAGRLDAAELRVVDDALALILGL